jgi:Coenzyme PQQ synthesis protein D (PqqD)
VESSRPRLAPSVHRDGNRMLDRASGRSIGLNETARQIVDGIDGARFVGEIASGLSEHFGVEERRALEDTTELIDPLRRDGLVRARPSYKYRLAYLVVTLRTFDVSLLRGGPLARKRVDFTGQSGPLTATSWSNCSPSIRGLLILTLIEEKLR